MASSGISRFCSAIGLAETKFCTQVQKTNNQPLQFLEQHPEGSSTMTKGRFVAYYRVSTDRLGRSGLGLEAQQEAVRQHLNGGSWELIAEVTEIESGKRNDRPRLTEALRLCRLYGATLIIAKIDRLARNVAFISNLMEASVDFVAVDFPSANRLTVHILAAVAEHEAKAISDRTKAALAAAKARGTKLGGDRGRFIDVRHLGSPCGVAVRQKKADQRAADLVPVICELQAAGMTVAAVARELTCRGIPTPRGKRSWASQQVVNVLARVSDRSKSDVWYSR